MMLHRETRNWRAVADLREDDVNWYPARTAPRPVPRPRRAPGDTAVTTPLFDAPVLALVELLFHRDRIVDDPDNPFIVAYFTREQWGAARDALEVLHTIGYGPGALHREPEPTPEPAPEPDRAIVINGVRYVPEAC
jgi:hypothetical protein